MSSKAAGSAVSTHINAKRASRQDDFSALYATWFTDVLEWVGALKVRTCDRQDIAQGVFVVVHRRLADWDRKKVDGWLYRITANQVRDYRKQIWNRAFFKTHEPELETIPSCAPTPVAGLETRDARKLLDGALSGLSEATQATFVLFDVQGFTCEEICGLHRVAPSTVRARLRRARHRVVARLLAWRETEQMKT